MKINWFLLNSGRLIKQLDVTALPIIDSKKLSESWIDIEEATVKELQNFLQPLELHPVIMGRCIDSKNSPGVISYDRAVLLEFPSVLSLDAVDPSFLTVILQDKLLVTIRTGQIPAVDDLISEIGIEKTQNLNHIIQIVYLILDKLTDISIQIEVEARDKTTKVAMALTDNPDKVNLNDLTNLRLQVDRLISLIENQLYCVSGLESSDNKALQEPHRKAYLQDLKSELEIAQRGAHRLETRVNGLYDLYQTIGSSRVEKRLRILTIISAVTLPFGLIAGLLGMNVGGLPATQDPQGFLIIIVLMLFIGAVELLFFYRKRWLE